MQRGQCAQRRKQIIVGGGEGVWLALRSCCGRRNGREGGAIRGAMSELSVRAAGVPAGRVRAPKQRAEARGQFAPEVKSPLRPVGVQHKIQVSPSVDSPSLNDRAGTRTQDLALKRRLLYQLSYAIGLSVANGKCRRTTMCESPHARSGATSIFVVNAGGRSPAAQGSCAAPPAPVERTASTLADRRTWPQRRSCMTPVQEKTPADDSAGVKLFGNGIVQALTCRRGCHQGRGRADPRSPAE